MPARTSPYTTLPAPATAKHLAAPDNHRILARMHRGARAAPTAASRGGAAGMLVERDIDPKLLRKPYDFPARPGRERIENFTVE